MKRHLVIPDTQCRSGDPVRHFQWIVQAVNEYKPDTVIHLGDHWDFPSLSSYDGVGSLKLEGSRVQADIEAGNKAMDILGGISHKCRKVFLVGNHEHRLSRAINKDPKLQGLIGDFLLDTTGWEVVNYCNGSPGQICIDGVMYAHYFPNPNTGKPIGGTVQNRLKNIGRSFVQGHVQGLSRGEVQFATGLTINGTVCGSAYLHDEDYKGAANSHWRGIVVLNEVKDGGYTDMALSLDYLCRKYEGMTVSRFLNKNYRNAKERFSLARTNGGGTHVE